SLPGGVIGRLYGQVGELGLGGVVGVGGVELGEFVGEDGQGPAVGDDVVGDEQDDVVVWCEAGEGGAEYRSGCQVEWVAELFADPGVGGVGWDVDDGQW